MSESEAIREIRNLRDLAVLAKSDLFGFKFNSDGNDINQLLLQTARRLIYYVWSSERAEVLEIMKDWHVN